MATIIHTYEVEVSLNTHRAGRRTWFQAQLKMQIEAESAETARIEARERTISIMEPWNRIIAINATLIECGGCAVCQPEGATL